ncbi:hypothetical protein [Rhodonellum psychrophilum]|uniref:hypothetical protein n=1 Tax=Rhodonellum psychrophilum TaxID=336828 RepID=UPI0011134EB5|nr:hypothetical protein [Rhodonellum psychrophilum]
MNFDSLNSRKMRAFSGIFKFKPSGLVLWSFGLYFHGHFAPSVVCVPTDHVIPSPQTIPFEKTTD